MLAPVLVFLFVATAAAQDPAPAAPQMDLQELLNIDLQVTSATKTATSAQEVAAIVTVVTSEDIERWGYRSIAELLQQTLGFYVIDDFIVPNAGVRGVSAGLWGESSAIKVMIDGHAVPFRPTAGNWLGPELVPMSAIDHVEIIRGPASVLYGADALLGVVNVVTRRDLQGASLQAGASAEASRLGYDQDISLGSRLGNFELLGAFRLSRRVRGGLTLPRSSPGPVVPAHRGESVRLADLEQNAQVGLLRVGYQRGSLRTSLSGWLSVIDRPGELSPWLQLADGLDPAGREVRNRISLQQQHLAFHLGWDPVARVDPRLRSPGLRRRPHPARPGRGEERLLLRAPAVRVPGRRPEPGGPVAPGRQLHRRAGHRPHLRPRAAAVDHPRRQGGLRRRCGPATSSNRRRPARGARTSSTPPPTPRPSGPPSSGACR